MKKILISSFMVSLALSIFCLARSLVIDNERKLCQLLIMSTSCYFDHGIIGHVTPENTRKFCEDWLRNLGK